MSKTDIKEYPSFEELDKLFSYNSVTGILTNKCDRGNRAKAGEEAGSYDTSGYRQVRIEGKQFRVHRIAWILHYGVPPTKFINHKNFVRSDNSINNLEDIDHQENMSHSYNSGKPTASSTTGFRGVTFDKKRGGYVAQITVNGICMKLGRYSTAEEASRVYTLSRAHYSSIKTIQV